MTLTPSSPAIRITGPDALIASIPYLLGFQPEHSLVIVWLHDESVVLTMRNDLPPLNQAPADRVQSAQLLCEVALRPVPQLPDDARPYVLAFCEATSEHTDDSVSPESPGELPFAGELLTVVDALRAVDRAPGDALCVLNDRWWSYLCESGRECDLCGHPMSDQVANDVAAQFVVLGRAPVSKRSDLRAELQAAPAGEVRRVHNAMTATGVKVGTRAVWVDLPPAVKARVWPVLKRLSQGVTPPSVDEQALALLGLRNPRTRDACLALAARADLTAVAEALVPLVRVSPPLYRAQAAASLATVRYFAGDGARTWVAIDAALHDDPRCTLAQLVGTALGAGMPPSVMRDDFATFDPDGILRGTGGVGKSA